MQRRVYEFAVAFKREHGRTPLLREIADAIGVTSPSTAHEHLRKLQAGGWVRMIPDVGFEICDGIEQQIADVVAGCPNCEAKVLALFNDWNVFVRQVPR